MVSKETLEALLKEQAFQAGAWQVVVEAARAYAQMEATGSYVENGVTHYVATDRKFMLQVLADKVLEGARKAFVEDARFGAELMRAQDK